MLNPGEFIAAEEIFKLDVFELQAYEVVGLPLCQEARLSLLVICVVSDQLFYTCQGLSARATFCR